MAQFDVHRNIDETTVDIFPYLLDIQNDLLSTLKTRVVVPLSIGMKPIEHLNPVFDIEGLRVMMSTADMAGIPLSYCGETVMNLAEYKNEIIDALDFLVNGF